MIEAASSLYRAIFALMLHSIRSKFDTKFENKPTTGKIR